jgi:hypothetical protein
MSVPISKASCRFLFNERYRLCPKKILPHINGSGSKVNSLTGNMKTIGSKIKKEVESLQPLFIYCISRYSII